MPRPEDSDLPHKAVLRVKVGDDDYGQPIVEEPVEIDCRWNTRRSQTVGKDGQLIGLDARVTVDRKIPIGSLMWKGEVKDWPGSGVDADDEELMQVMAYTEVDDVKGRDTVQRVLLKRFRDTLPG